MLDEANLVQKIALLIEDAAKEKFKDRHEQMEYVLIIAVNVLGNLTIRWAEEPTLSCIRYHIINVIDSLGDWYKDAIKDLVKRNVFEETSH